MLLAHALMRLPMTSAAPAGSTLLAEDPYYGTEDAGAAAGYDTSFFVTCGSLDPNIINGFEVLTVLDVPGFGAFYFLVSGDQVAALSGLSLWIDNDEFPFASMPVPPQLGGGGTTVAAMTPYGFVHGQSYTIDIR